MSRLVKTEPTLLVFQGGSCRQRCAVRVVEVEVLTAVREPGCASLDRIASVVLEIDGSFSVVQRKESGTLDALAGVAVVRWGEYASGSLLRVERLFMAKS